MPYNPDHTWERDVFFRASLRSMVNLFASAGYKVVATSLNGTNLFLVYIEYTSRYEDEPSSVKEIFNLAMNFLFKTRYKVGIRLSNSIVGKYLD
jgi:hypothetical protein